MILRSLVSLAAPTAVAIAAFLHARAIGSLVDTAVSPGSVAPPASIAPFVEARAEARSARPILARNPFDSAYVQPGAATVDPVAEADPRNARPCDGVRAVATVRGETADASFAALEIDGKSVLLRRGGGPGGNVVVHVGQDRVWLRQNGVLCQARLFGSPAAASVAPAASQATALEREIAGRIVRSGEHEYQIDRATLERIFETQAELLKVPLVPEKDGLRIVRVKPGSLPALAGLMTGDRLVTVNGFEVTSAERMLEAYARLRSGADMIRLRVVRNGAPIDLDYAVR